MPKYKLKIKDKKEPPEYITNMFIAVEAIRKKHGKVEFSTVAEMKCPVCFETKGGILTYSIAATNQHIHAKCSTPKCICFIM